MSKTRGGNWKPQEDIAMCIAVITVGEDGDKGTAQEKKKLWDRINAVYETCKPANVEVRGGGGCDGRWRKIRPACQRWREALNIAASNRKSGDNPTDETKWRKITSNHEKEMQKLKRCPHQYVKVVKFCGFVGYGNEMELAAYLIEIAMELEEISIEPNKEKLPLWASRWARYQKATKIRKRSIEGQAKSQLNKKLPPGAKLCFL